MASNSNSYTLHLSASQPQDLSLLSAAGSASNPNLSSDNHRSFSPGMGQYFRRASSGLRSDLGAKLWVSLGMQVTFAASRRMSPYPGTNASLGMGMSDLGEPPSSEEVALSRRGSCAG